MATPTQVYLPAPLGVPTTEDDFLAQFFRDTPTGFFLDVGAHDGRSYSNTRPLWERGWSGILVEPSPATFAKLLANYPNKERLTFLNVALTPTGGPVTFTEHTDPDRTGWHSLCPEWIATWEPGTRREITVESKRFEDLPLPPAIDFLSIDTEGYDITLLRAMPSWLRPRLIMCEVDKHLARERIEQEMGRRAYKFCWGTYLNSAYAAA